MKFVETGMDEQARSFVVKSLSLEPPSARAETGPGHPRVLLNAALGGTPTTLDSRQSGALVDLADYGWPTRAGAAVWGATTYGPDTEIPMHHSATLDFIFIVAGATTLRLDLAEVVLQQGDSVYLPSVSHGWRMSPDGCLLSSIVVALPQ